MKAFDKICKMANRLFEAIGMILLVGMIIALFTQVFTRFAMHNPASWTEEFARYAFIWVTMMGCSLCVANGSHATVTLLNDHLHGNVKRAHKIAIELFVIACAAVLLYYGIRLIPKTKRSFTPTLHISMGLIYASVPVGMAGVILGCVNHIVQLFVPADGEEENR